jgi:hypothetical protein
LEELPLIKELDRNKKYTDLLKDYEYKLKEYVKRLRLFQN